MCDAALAAYWHPSHGDCFIDAPCRMHAAFRAAFPSFLIAMLSPDQIRELYLTKYWPEAYPGVPQPVSKVQESALAWATWLMQWLTENDPADCN